MTAAIPRGVVASSAVGVLGLVAWRALAHPVDTYGDSGAGYIEHLERVRVLSRLTTAGGSLFDRLRAADGLYPPGLHLLSAPASLLGEHVPAAVTPLGAVWLLLLAAAVGGVARALHPRAFAPAFAVTLFVPALHAVAPRYYYDLPMTALVWLAGAALAWSHEKPVRNGLLAAGAFSLACFVKWSALPLGLSILLGSWLYAARDDRPGALRAAAVFVGGTALLVGPALAFSTSFGAMGGATFQPPPGVALPGWSVALDELRPGLGHALGAMAVQARLDGPTRALFYLHRLGTTVLAPALVPFALLFAGAWVSKRAPGGAGLAVMAVPVLLFVLFAVPPLDERFLLTVVPTLSVVAGLALADAPGWLRPVAPVTAVLGLAVAADFHLGGPHPGPESPATTGHEIPLRWGLSTSIDRRGWARADDLPDHRDALRAALLQVVEDRNATHIVGDDRLIADRGDLNWWTFVFERATLASDAPQRIFRPTGSGLAELSAPPSLAFTRGDSPPPAGFVPLEDIGPIHSWTRARR